MIAWFKDLPRLVIDRLWHWQCFTQLYHYGQATPQSAFNLLKINTF
jgi:hypothetical protein